MAKIPFDIKYRPQIESGEYKVETRDGKKVRVLCYDANNIVPIVALVTFNDGSEGSRDYYSDGTMNCDRKNPLDLFIVTPEEELTEFEKVVREAIEYDPETSSEEEIEQAVRGYAEDILELAKKEALKDLPRWIELGCVTQVPYAIIKTWHGEYRIGATVEPGDRFIPLGMLEKLPGFKED